MIARERSLGSSPTDLPSAGPGPSGPLNTALGSDGQGQTSFSSVFFGFSFLILFFELAWFHLQLGSSFVAFTYATAGASYGS